MTGKAKVVGSIPIRVGELFSFHTKQRAVLSKQKEYGVQKLRSSLFDDLNINYNITYILIFWSHLKKPII